MSCMYFDLKSGIVFPDIIAPPPRGTLMSGKKIVKFQELIDFTYVTFGSMCRADYHNTFLCNCESALANGTVYTEVEMDIRTYFNFLVYIIQFTHSGKAENFKLLEEYILSIYNKPIVDSQYTTKRNKICRENYERQVIEEHAECVDRINKLRDIINGRIYNVAFIDEQERRCKQLDLMEQLRDVLAQRIEAFNK